MAEKNEAITVGETSEQKWSNIPIDLRECDVYITYVQNDEIVIERTNDTLDIDYNQITYRLTQEETLNLEAGKAKTQIKFKLPNGYVGYSAEKKVRVLDAQKKVVI